MKPLIKDMSENLQKGMTWLAKTFSETLHDPAQDSQDIYQDLWVVYLERKAEIEKRPLKKGYTTRDNLWFIVFKNYLLNKAKRAKLEPNSLKAALDKNPYENTVYEE
jgi:hypothetical protein